DLAFDAYIVIVAAGYRFALQRYPFALLALTLMQTLDCPGHLGCRHIAGTNADIQLFDTGGVELAFHASCFAGLQIQAAELAFERLPSGRQVFLLVGLPEPVANLGARPRRANVAQVRNQPIAGRARLFRGQNLDAIAVAQAIGQRHDAAIDLGATAAMPDL